MPAPQNHFARHFQVQHHQIGKRMNVAIGKIVFSGKIFNRFDTITCVLNLNLELFIRQRPLEKQKVVLIILDD